MKEFIRKVAEKLPISSYVSIGHNFLTVDTSGRIIIEDFDKIVAFTDELLIVKQGKIILTFIGEGLNLKNLSRHSAQLSGQVGSIRLEREGK